EGLRAERARQGPAGPGVHVLQARREEGRHHLRRTLPPGQDRRADPGEHTGVHRVLARDDSRDGRPFDLRRQGGRGWSGQDHRRTGRRRDPVDEGARRQGLLRGLSDLTRGELDLRDRLIRVRRVRDEPSSSRIYEKVELLEHRLSYQDFVAEYEGFLEGVSPVDLDHERLWSRYGLH